MANRLTNKTVALPARGERYDRAAQRWVSRRSPNPLPKEDLKNGRELSAYGNPNTATKADGW
jgi:hypothetical protein